MTWCIFIATNCNLVFLHKQHIGKIYSGFWDGLSFTLHEEMQGKWQRDDAGPVCRIHGVSGTYSHFPYLNPCLASVLHITNPRYFYRERRVTAEHTQSCSLEALWWGFFGRSSVLLCLMIFLKNSSLGRSAHSVGQISIVTKITEH